MSAAQQQQQQPSSYHRSDNADAYRTNASFVFSDENTREILKLLDPQPGDVILDVGCGSGELTKKLYDLVTANGAPGAVIGVDLSTSMIDAAQAQIVNKDDKQNLRFAVCDGHDLVDWLEKENLVGTFDKVFSNAALHWMKRDPAQVVKGMHAALRTTVMPTKPTPVAKLVVEFGGFMNTIAVRSSLHAALRRRNVDAEKLDPWYFPTPSAYTKLLRQFGFEDVDTAYLFPRPTPLPRATGFRGWLKSFAGPFLNGLPSNDERESVVDELEEQLKVDMYDDQADEWTLMCEFAFAMGFARVKEIRVLTVNMSAYIHLVTDVRLRIRASMKAKSR